MTCPQCAGAGDPLPDDATGRLKCLNLKCRVYTYTPEHG